MPFTKFEFCCDMFDELTEKLDEEYEEVSDSWKCQEDIIDWLEEFFNYNGNNNNSIYYFSVFIEDRRMKMIFFEWIPFTNEKQLFCPSVCVSNTLKLVGFLRSKCYLLYCYFR